jgi:eukaryotic-like serine/threonine-protein kinase
MTLQGRMLGGHYALGAMLGSGRMGQVYRARDRVLQRTVAVKVLGHPSDQDPAMVARFAHEARAAAGEERQAVAQLSSAAQRLE